MLRFIGFIVVAILVVRGIAGFVSDYRAMKKEDKK